MLSIVIPVYNVDLYLRECLDSIIQNCVCEWEAILVDDGSNDQSGSICDEYSQKDSRFIVLHQENKGVSAARNSGLMIAKGEWISFVDSDDKVLSGYGEELLCNPSFDIIYFGFDKKPIWNSEQIERLDVEQELFNLKYNKTGYEFFGYTCNKFFRRLIIVEHNISFPIGQKHREDEYFTGEYCHWITNLKVVSEPRYWYRDEGSNGHLTGRNISPSELMNIASNIIHQLEYWSYKDLRDYELFRAARLMYDALRKTCNLYGQYLIAKVVRNLDFDVLRRLDNEDMRLPPLFLFLGRFPMLLVCWINVKKIVDKIKY